MSLTRVNPGPSFKANQEQTGEQAAGDWLRVTDTLCMATCLDITLDGAAELLTDGGNDAGVDGLHVGDVDDGEFLVTLFQGKYKRDLAKPLCLMDGV